MMIIDSSNCETIHEIDQYPDKIPDNVSDMLILRLTKEIWVVALSDEGSEARRDELTKSHFQSKLLKHVKPHSDDDIFIIPLIYLYRPCFDYCATQDNVTSTDDRTSYIGRPQNE